MKHADRAAYVDGFLEEYVLAVLRDKGQEYSRGEADVNSNFKRGAEAIGTDPISVAYVYLSKHLDSIAHYIKTRATPSGEPIEGRLGDAVNYLIIIGSMIDEERRATADATHAAERPAREHAAKVLALATVEDDIADASRYSGGC